MTHSTSKEPILHSEENGAAIAGGNIPEILGIIPMKDTVVFTFTVVPHFVN